MTENKQGCITCGTLEVELTDDYAQDDATGNKLYWFGAMKGTDDFSILRTHDEHGIQLNFLVYEHPSFPYAQTVHYDWYCYNCFLRIAQNQGYEFNERELDEDPEA